MINSLSYVGFSSPDTADWQTFAPLLGMGVVFTTSCCKWKTSTMWVVLMTA